MFCFSLNCGQREIIALEYSIEYRSVNKYPNLWAGQRVSSVWLRYCSQTNDDTVWYYIYIYGMDRVCQRCHKGCSQHAHAQMITTVVEKVHIYIYIYIFPINVFPKLCVELKTGGLIWQSVLCVIALERFLHIWDLIILVYIFVIFDMGIAASQSSLCHWFGLCSYRMPHLIALANQCVFRYLESIYVFVCNYTLSKARLNS